MKIVLVAESVRAAAEGHVRGLRRIKVVVVPDPLLTGVSGTESSQGVITLVKLPQWRIEQLFRGCPLVVVSAGEARRPAVGAKTEAVRAAAERVTNCLRLITVSPLNFDAE